MVRTMSKIVLIRPAIIRDKKHEFSEESQAHTWYNTTSTRTVYWFYLSATCGMHPSSVPHTTTVYTVYNLSQSINESIWVVDIVNR